MTGAHLKIAAAAACLGASLLVAGPLSARDAGHAAGCVGEGSQQIPGTWQIEDREAVQATSGEGRPDRNVGPAEERLHSDCALV